MLAKCLEQGVMLEGKHIWGAKSQRTLNPR